MMKSQLHQEDWKDISSSWAMHCVVAIIEVFGVTPLHVIAADVGELDEEGTILRRVG